jgi:hypothetical protein
VCWYEAMSTLLGVALLVLWGAGYRCGDPVQ